MFVKLQAELRDSFTKSGKTNLRKRGRIPAVVYGKKIPDTPLSVDEKQVVQLLRNQPNALVDLEIAGKLLERAVIQEVQKDAFTGKVLSLGFRQVESTDAVRVKVRLELLLEPGDKELEVQFVHHELEVQCLPQDIPAVLKIDPEPLRQGHAVLVRDIGFPEGVKPMLPPEEVVVTILHTAASHVAADEEAAETPA